MKRRLLKLAVFLLAGAIINVAMAWGCVCWSDPVRRQRRESEQIVWQAPVPADWPPMATHWRETSFGITDCSALGSAPSRADTWTRGTAQWVLRAGWPYRALFVERHRTEVWTGLYFPLSFDRPSDWCDRILIPDGVPWCDIQGIRYLPTRPIWSGFAINTMFYAAIVWMLFAAPFALRRWRRIRGGLCPACAYPVGASEACTECGYTLKASG